MQPWHEASYMLDSTTDATQALATRLIQLKSIFPGGDAARILLQSPVFVMTQDAAAIQGSADRLRQLLPGVDVDRCGFACIVPQHLHFAVQHSMRQVQVLACAPSRCPLSVITCIVAQCKYFNQQTR